MLPCYFVLYTNLTPSYLPLYKPSIFPIYILIPHHITSLRDNNLADVYFSDIAMQDLDTILHLAIVINLIMPIKFYLGN